MKFKRFICYWFSVVAILLALACPSHAQGTLTFDDPWIFSGGQFLSVYYEQGVRLRVEAIAPDSPYHTMTRIGSDITGGTAHNGTPHMRWSRFDGRTDYVVISMTDESTFGLASVDLGNFGSSLQAAISITFNGFRLNGSMVSETFTTPENDFTNFTPFHFGPEFASGLTRVEIPSQFWVMDNLVWVPEPGAYALLGLGLLIIALRTFRQCDTK